MQCISIFIFILFFNKILECINIIDSIIKNIYFIYKNKLSKYYLISIYENIIFLKIFTYRFIFVKLNNIYY